MITKSYHDIYDLVELVLEAKNAQIEINTDDGEPRFCVTCFRDDNSVLEGIDVQLSKNAKTSILPMRPEVTEEAYNMVKDRLDSGRWERHE